ncbi:MAG: quinol:cytochrome C oxidoreductase [Thalassobius sp.]|nr:quinol:cytochrome C oxidoreductase [Thalassovita sp.]
MASEIHDIDLNEKFHFSDKAKKTLFIILGLGVVSLVIGILVEMLGGGGHGEHASLLMGNDALASSEPGAAAEGHAFHWWNRLFVDMWINNVYFTGISLIGIFWVAIQYVASAGWSAGFKRVPEAFGAFLPVTGVLMLVVFVLASHDMFHWTHTDLYDKASAHFDKIINGKKGFFFIPGSEATPSIPFFYYLRMIFFFLGWMLFYNLIRKQSLLEDVNAGLVHYRKMVTLSGAFLVFFGLSSSMSAWDWVMSIDTHWFSTMFGWYVFASWFVSGLAAITLFLVLLKEAGFLSIVNENHLHDMGKFVFGFSIFWTYIWFSQYLLIYYANMPEETIYFYERLNSDIYSKYIFFNLIMNFFFPFLGLMTRDAKRKMTLLKIVCVVVLVGHWFDFFLMITPGTLKQNGGFGFMELGVTMIYLFGFLWVVLSNLAKQKLIAVNHPMLQESIHHTT